MKTFREFVNEETMPFAQTEKGFVGIDSPAVRDNINSLIAGVTDCEFLTPYIALERVAKVLANFHIFLPKQTFLDSDRGMVAIEINQFGEKVGMQDNGEVVTQASSPYYLFFEYEVDDNGTFEVFSEVVTEEELDEIVSDMDEEDEELDEEKDSEEDDEEEDEDEKEEKLDEACWEGYKQVGTKMKGGREVPNCVPLEEAVKKLVAKALKEAEGTHLDAPQKGKLASINKLNKEEKSGMPAWYEKEKSKSASLQAATKAKKKEQQKKTDYAIRNMKEENADDKHFASQSKKKQDAINNQLRQGKSYKDAVKATKQVKEEQIDEQSKAKLAGYIKAASHDVAAKSAAVRGFARDAEAQRKDKKPMDARKSDERADKMFKKSWNRRQYMAKAVDKLTKEELSPADKGRVAAGYRGSVSNPAKQGAIAAYLDDQERDRKKQQKAKTPEKANFNVAKKLARQAVKAQKAKNK